MRVADLFSGCGGMSLGLRASGMEPVFAADHWSEAAEVYTHLLEHAPKILDLSDVVRTVTHVRRERPDIVAGGPPCQDFSAAGNRKEAARADLTLAYAEAVVAIRPTWFVMENVLLARSSVAYKRARKLFEQAGYGITEKVLNAAYYGVPQIRKRLIVIGRQDELDDFLSEEIDDRATDEALTVRDYVGDEFGIQFYYRHPRVWEKRAIYSIDEPAATIRTVNRPIPMTYRSHPMDAAPPRGIRQLTPRERARVQTFPKRIKFRCSMTMADEMVGNAVPVKLAEHVGRAIMAHEKIRGSEPSLESFRYWLSDCRGFNERSAGSVLSRLKRSKKFLRGQRFTDHRDAAHALSKVSEFAALPSSVRSQIRRALELYAEFNGHL